MALPKQSSGSVQGRADKDPNSSEKFIPHKNVGHDPKDVKIQKLMYSTNFWGSRGKYILIFGDPEGNIDLLGVLAFQAFTGPYRRF